MNFNDSTKNNQSWLLTTPLVVPTTDDPDKETSDQLMSRQDKFLKLSRGIKKKLSSVKTSQKIQAIGQKYQFELLRLANITRLIREYYFGEVRLENFPAEIEKRMGVSLLTAQEITRYLKQEILDWDPWGEYLARLPHLPLRQILAEYPKIGNMEITAGYIELKGSEEPEEPTIKNWLHDFVLHLGQERHSQIQRTDYLFHSENGKGLNSQDREKLGIILRSFDENTPLPVDEENNEIVFDGIENRVGDAHVHPAPAANTKTAYTRPLHEEQKPAPQITNNFIKPYAPISRPTSPRPSPYKGEGDRPIPQFRPVTSIPDNFASQTGKKEISKYFSTPESPDIPSIKIHSITEHNEPKIVQQVAPRPSVQRPTPTSPQPSPYKGEGVARPKHRMIEPFFSKPMPEPRLDGNIVDLSEQ